MGLVELGRHTELSPAMLSKIERGQLFPTLPTLLRIALVFSVGLDYFFSGSREKPTVGVVRHKDRLRFPEKAGARDQAYEFESLDYPALERRLTPITWCSYRYLRRKCGSTSMRVESSFTCSLAS